MPPNDAPDTSARLNSRLTLHEADMVLNEFRQQLRTQAARSVVPPDTVPSLRRQLADVRASILATLHP